MVSFKDSDEIRELARPAWMKADEALEYGLISKIISNRDELKKINGEIVYNLSLNDEKNK